MNTHSKSFTNILKSSSFLPEEYFAKRTGMMNYDYVTLTDTQQQYFTSSSNAVDKLVKIYGEGKHAPVPSELMFQTLNDFLLNFFMLDGIVTDVLS